MKRRRLTRIPNRTREATTRRARAVRRAADSRPSETPLRFKPAMRVEGSRSKLPTAPTVVVIQHAAVETPGRIAEALRARGVALEFIRPFRGDRIPRRLGTRAGLVVMGGPMGVYEQDRYPFLRREIELLREAVSRGRPVLGVCLGSQLLAAALGAPVTPGKQKEIGWHPVTLSRAAARDGLWRGVPGKFTAFHWHGDVFELPRGATALARSPLTACQAFRFGESAYGLLFHLEVTAGIVARMVRRFRREMHEAGVEARGVLAAAPARLPQLERISRKVFARWAAQVSSV